MNLARRVVVTIALAFALAVIAVMVDRVSSGPPDGGWFMYDPTGEGVPFSSGGSDGDALRSAGIWLAAIAVWSVIAWRLFRTPGDRAGR